MSNDTFSHRRSLLLDAAERGARYLESLEKRRVQPERAAVERLREFLAAPLAERGAPPAEVLAELDAFASPATLATAGPRFFGFVTGGALPAPLAANVLAAAWDQVAFSTTASPAGAALEECALRWTLELLGLPGTCGGSLVTSATLANLSALAAARHALLERQGWDVESRGLFGAPPLRVYLGAEAHPSVRKALGLLGLGRDRVEILPVDTQGRISGDAFPALDEPAIVCAQAGNVNSGASDPFPALRAWCDTAGAWLHVDGAFGLFAAASPRLARQRRGRGDGGLVGHRRAQVAERAVRLRDRLRQGRRGAARDDGAAARRICPSRPGASPSTSLRSSRAVRGASRCGRRSGASAGKEWPSWWSAAVATRRASPGSSARRATRC